MRELLPMSAEPPVRGKMRPMRIGFAESCAQDVVVIAAATMAAKTAENLMGRSSVLITQSYMTGPGLARAKGSVPGNCAALRRLPR
jgi:hypothetical protein